MTSSGVAWTLYQVVRLLAQPQLLHNLILCSFLLYYLFFKKMSSLWVLQQWSDHLQVLTVKTSVTANKNSMLKLKNCMFYIDLKPKYTNRIKYLSHIEHMNTFWWDEMQNQDDLIWLSVRFRFWSNLATKFPALRRKDLHFPSTWELRVFDSVARPFNINCTLWFLSTDNLSKGQTRNFN